LQSGNGRAERFHLRICYLNHNYKFLDIAKKDRIMHMHPRSQCKNFFNSLRHFQMAPSDL
jgi:hypothetical protein